MRGVDRSIVSVISILKSYMKFYTGLGKSILCLGVRKEHFKMAERR